MSTYRNNAANLCNTADTTRFRAWVTDAVAMLDGAGWNKASDTGMLDETTVTWPGVISTYAGYQIWYLNDSLHSTYPLYMRIGWGQGSSAARVLMSVQFGYATNGTGSLSGWTSPAYSPLDGGSNAVTSSATGINLASGGEGYAWFINGRGSWGGLSNVPVLVQREFDTDGSIKNNGNWSVIWQGATSGSYMQGYSVNRSTSIAYGSSVDICLIPQGATVSGTGTELELHKGFVKYPNISTVGSSCTYFTNEIQIDSTFSGNIAGSSRTFTATGVTGWSQTHLGGHALAAIWE